MDQRCREKAAELLAAFETPPIDPALKAVVDDYVARRQSEISPAIS